MEEQERNENYKTLLSGGTAEIVEKKSRFIATIEMVDSTEKAQRFIEELRKRYWDATHNCYAYVIGKRGETVKCSDDGEPSQTAGRPMLDVLQNSEIKNVVVVVTRYFGGTLLGTGGLVRAYQKAVSEALKECTVGYMQYGICVEYTVEYAELNKIQYLLEQEKIEATKIRYEDNVILELVLPLLKEEMISGKIVQLTNGKAKIDKKDRRYFIDKKETL